MIATRSHHLFAFAYGEVLLPLGSVLPLLLPSGCAASARHEQSTAPHGPISTDRPGFLFSSSLVPEGALQVEAGTPLVALDEEAGQETSLVSIPVQLRYGLSPSVELRLGSPVYDWLRTDPGSDEDGFGDVEVGAKVPLPLPLGQDAAALVVGVLLPVGDDAFQVDVPAPAFAGFLATKLLTDTVQLDASVHRGLTDASSDWLLGIGMSARF